MEALKKVLDPIFGIDLRSLAVARISFALLVLFELFARAKSITKFYGESGVLPPYSLIEPAWYAPWTWSIHLFFGETPGFLVLILILHICATLCLLIGYRTRIATIIICILLISLDHTNPFVMNGGGNLIRLLLLISIFLPLGAVFSVDQAQQFRDKFRDTEKKRVLSFWSAAFLIQILCMYLFSALSKYFGSEWLSGDAIYYVLSMDHIATSFGKMLLDTPQILPYLTLAVFYFEHIAPLLLLSPYYTLYLRAITLSLLVFMHLAFALSLHIGLFSLIPIAGLVAFIPTELWDKVMSRLKNKFGGVKIYYDGDCGFCRRSVWLIYVFFALPESSVGGAQENPSIFADMQKNDSWVVVGRDQRKYFGFEAMIVLLAASPLFFFLAPLGKINFISMIGEKIYRFVATHRPRVCPPQQKTPPSFTHSSLTISILGFAYIIFILLWNIVDVAGGASSLKISQNTWRFARTLGIDQSWRLFVANDIKNNSWYVIPGTLEDGSYVDVYRNGAPLSFERRRPDEPLYDNGLWRKYLTFIKRPENHAYRIQYAKLLCNKWNKVHKPPKTLVSFELGAMNIPIPPPGEKLPKPGYINLLSWKCEQI